MTDEELRAHDGADAPSGWEPVDGGNARVFVPSDWLVEAGGTCVGGGSAQGIVSIGRLVHAGCQPAGQWPVPEQAVSLIPMATVPSVAPAQVVHGYRVYLAARSSLEWRVYDVPQLGVALYLRGTLGDRVLATLAPSALKVAVTVASEPVPRGHRITTDGVAMTLPPAWRVTTATWRPCSWMSASPNGTAWVERIPPGLGVPSCPAPWLTAVNTIHEGMFLYTSPASGGPSQPATSPAAVLHHGSSTVRVYPDDADPRVLDVFVHREGSRETRVLQLGLGRDGRVVGGILASLAAVS